MGSPSKNVPASNRPERTVAANARDATSASALWNVLVHGSESASSKPPVPRKTAVAREPGAKGVAAYEPRNIAPRIGRRPSRRSFTDKPPVSAPCFATNLLSPNDERQRVDSRSRQALPPVFGEGMGRTAWTPSYNRGVLRVASAAWGCIAAPKFEQRSPAGRRVESRNRASSGL